MFGHSRPGTTNKMSWILAMHGALALGMEYQSVGGGSTALVPTEIYFNYCLIDCHEILYRHSWFPEDES